MLTDGRAHSVVRLVAYYSYISARIVEPGLRDLQKVRHLNGGQELHETLVGAKLTMMKISSSASYAVLEAMRGMRKEQLTFLGETD